MLLAYYEGKSSLSLSSFPPKGRREGLLLLSPLPPMRPRPTSLSLPLSRPWKRRERRGKERKGSSLSSAIARWRKKKRLFPSNVEAKRKEEKPAYSVYQIRTVGSTTE